MADRQINIHAERLMQAGEKIAETLETAAKPPTGIFPLPVMTSPADAAANAVAASMQAKIAALSAELAPAGPEMRAKTASTALTMTAADEANAAQVRAVGERAPMDWTSPYGGGAGDGVQALGFKTGGGGFPPLSEARRRALEYADRWAHGVNPDFEDFGSGGGDCTNFASQVMRAGGFQHVGSPFDLWDDDKDQWYYENSMRDFKSFDRSASWAVAQANRDFVLDSGRGKMVGTAPMPAREALDPLAPSKAGLVPGDLIYYHDEATGTINHTAVYVGQQMRNGKLVDVVDQHAWGDNNFRNDWMPDHPGFTGGKSSVEFVHLTYPGE